MVRSSGIAILVAGALALAACGDGDGDVDEAGATTGPTATAADTPATTEEAETTGAAEDDGEASVTLDTASTDLGDVLVDGDGMTLYMFDNDTEGESACVDDCAATWPPVTGQAEAAGEVDEGMIGTITRPDGSTQVTYGGFPLYLYAADAEPGDVNGQGVGEVWWVVGPDGARITETAAADATIDY